MITSQACCFALLQIASRTILGDQCRLIFKKRECSSLYSHRRRRWFLAEIFVECASPHRFRTRCMSQTICATPHGRSRPAAKN